jgi:hypothetical protein
MNKINCGSEVRTVASIYNTYTHGGLVKPRINRRIRWEDKSTSETKKAKANSYDFIEFIVQTGDVITPLLLAENVKNDRVTLSVIDGNNRLNAIIRFVENPLVLFYSLIPRLLPDEIKEHLKRMSLQDILGCRDFRAFCKASNFQELYTTTMETQLSNDFDTMLETIFNMRFFDIKVPITVFRNMTLDQITDIFEGVNRGGIPLSNQEVLASTTFSDTYSPDEIEKYTMLKTVIERDYYGAMETTEVLSVEGDGGRGMTLFEILQALFIELKRRHDWVENTRQDAAYDFVFNCYLAIFRSFEPVKREDVAKINEFVSNMILACEDLSVMVKRVSSDATLGGYKLMLMLMILFHNQDKLSVEDFYKVVQYNYLCKIVGDDELNSKNPLFIKITGGSSALTAARSFLQNGLKSPITDEDLQYAYACANKKAEVLKPKKKRNLVDFEL